MKHVVAASLALVAALAIESPLKAAAAGAQPRWFQSLKSKAIAPGMGLAGVKFGDRVERVRTVLGKPDSMRPIHAVGGAFVATVWTYEWEGRLLSLSFNASEQLSGMRLIDHTFNADQAHTIRGSKVIPGSSVFDLSRAMRRPHTIDFHVTCPNEVAAGVAYDWAYNGISYCVCGNNKVYWIDIRR